MKARQAQAWYAPEFDQLIKVETVSDTKSVANLPTGPERITHHEMRAQNWEHRGPWIEKKPMILDDHGIEFPERGMA